MKVRKFINVYTAPIVSKTRTKQNVIKILCTFAASPGPVLLLILFMLLFTHQTPTAGLSTSVAIVEQSFRITMKRAARDRIGL